MAASSARVGYGAVLGRQASNLTTIAAATTGSSTPQSRTPAAMTSIDAGTVLCIDTASTTVKEVTKVISDTGSTFTSIIENNHSGGISIALMVPVAELTSINGFSLTCDTPEATHLTSDNTYRERLAGIPDGGQVSIEGNYLPDDASQLQMVTDLQARTKRSWSISLGGTPGNDNQCIWWADAYMTNITPTAQVDGVIKFTATLQLTGKAYLHY